MHEKVKQSNHLRKEGELELGGSQQLFQITNRSSAIARNQVVCVHNLGNILPYY